MSVNQSQLERSFASPSSSSPSPPRQQQLQQPLLHEHMMVDDDHAALLLGMDELPDDSEPNSAAASDYPSAHTSDFVTTPASASALSAVSSSASFASWSASSNHSTNGGGGKRTSSITTSVTRHTHHKHHRHATHTTGSLACMDRWLTHRERRCRCGGLFKGVYTSRANYVCSVLVTIFLLILLGLILVCYVVLPSIVPAVLDKTEIQLLGINVTSPSADTTQLALTMALSTPSGSSSATVRAYFSSPVHVSLVVSEAEYLSILRRYNLYRSDDLRRTTTASTLRAGAPAAPTLPPSPDDPITIEFGTLLVPSSLQLDPQSPAPFAVDAPLRVTNSTAFTAFLIELLNRTTVTWQLQTQLTITARILSYQLPGVDVPFERQITLDACDGLHDTRLLHYSLDRSTMQHVLLDLAVRLHNPSMFRVAPLGTLTLELLYNDQIIGTLISDSDVMFGLNDSDVSLHGEFHPITSEAQRAAVGDLFTTILGNQTAIVRANGQPVNSSSVPLYSPGLAALSLEVAVPPPANLSTLITNITIRQLGGTVRPNSTCVSSLLLDGNLTAQLLLPQTVRVQSNVTAMNMTILMGQQGQSDYQLQLDVVNATVVHTHHDYPQPDLLNITMPLTCLVCHVPGGKDCTIPTKVHVLSISNATLAMPIGDVIVRNLTATANNMTLFGSAVTAIRESLDGRV